MTVTTVKLLAIVTGVVSFGYILFGGFLLRRYDGIGVRSLSLFSVLWGAKFVLGSVAFYVLASNGVTDGASTRLANIDTPMVNLLRNFEPTLVALLTVSGIFVWFWFILRYTRRIGRREKLAVAAVGGGTFVLRTLAGVAGAASTSELLFIGTARFIRFVGVIEILGTVLRLESYRTVILDASNHQPFSERAVVVSHCTCPLWIVGYLYRFMSSPN
ncbi:MAG: hypothetical protein J07HN6_00159, partial [Halonotius sp. J07HN6]